MKTSTTSIVRKPNIALVAALLAFACALGTLAVAPKSALAHESSGDSLVVGQSYISADSSWGFSAGNVTLKRYNTPVTVRLTGATGSYYNYYASSSNSGIAKVSSMSSSGGTPYFTITKQGVGSTTITVRNYYTGESRTVMVNCNPTDFNLNNGNFTFSKKTKYYTRYSLSPRYADQHAPDSIIRKAKSSKPKVASVAVKRSGTYSYVVVTPKKAGKAKIRVTDQYNRAKTVVVKVKKNYFKPNLQCTSYAYAYYGNKTVSVYTVPNAKVTVTIGGKKFTGKANSDGSAKVKVSGIYKKGTKFKYTCKTPRAKVTKTATIGSNSYCYFNGSVWSCKRYVPVKVTNVHYGDSLTIRSGYESHTIWFYGNYSWATRNFYMNYNLRNYSYLSLTYKNKYGQVLDTDSWYIRW